MSDITGSFKTLNSNGGTMPRPVNRLDWTLTDRSQIRRLYNALLERISQGDTTAMRFVAASRDANPGDYFVPTVSWSKTQLKELCLAVIAQLPALALRTFAGERAAYDTLVQLSLFADYDRDELDLAIHRSYTSHPATQTTDANMTRQIRQHVRDLLILAQQSNNPHALKAALDMDSEYDYAMYEVRDQLFNEFGVTELRRRLH